MSVEQPPVTAPENEPKPRPGHLHPEIERPADLPPAPVGRAKILIGAVLLVLITAGVMTFVDRKGETDALAKETEAVASIGSPW